MGPKIQGRRVPERSGAAVVSSAGRSCSARPAVYALPIPSSWAMIRSITSSAPPPIDSNRLSRK